MEKCKHVKCNEIATVNDWCAYHGLIGGYFGSGKSYTQYQIIEQDFLDFIKIIPLEYEKNMDVQSPVLRDIILRSCTQIEIFFKEWGLYEISSDNNSSLHKKFNKNSKKERNWNFGDYYELKQKFNPKFKLRIIPLNEDILPFTDFKDEKTLPDWWNAYNSIKHSGTEGESKATLRTALDTLSSLFYLHCQQSLSKNYLEDYVTNDVYRKSTVNDKIYVKLKKISTPIDSKKHLFVYHNSTNEKEIEILTLQTLKDVKNQKRRF